MADYSKSKKFGQTQTNGVTDGEAVNMYPVYSSETTNLFGRVEGLITPKKLTSRFLKGIDVEDFSTLELKDYIEEALNEVEMLLHLNLTPVQYKERIPFDRDAYRSFVFFKTSHGPIMSIEKLSIQSSNGENIYNLPPTWIEMGQAHKRQVNLIPILSIFGAAGLQDGQPSNAGLVFLQAVNNFQWLPAFYTITYTAGICRKDGNLPKIVNRIVGITAAMHVLSQKAAQNKYTATAISQDGISQSASGPGPQVYQNRINDLETERERLIGHVRSKFNQKYFVTHF